jgi:hypothetical protein
MLVQAAGVDIRRKSMVIGNEMKIVKFILERDPILQRPNEMTQVQFPRGTHPAQYSFLSCQ